MVVSQRFEQGVLPRTFVLGPEDLSSALDVIRRDPVTNVFAEYRARLTSLDQRWLGGQMWGCLEDGQLVALCHVGANLVPVQADDRACAAFAQRARRRGRTSSTIVGPQDAVRSLWSHLEDVWDQPRDARWDQPHLELSDDPSVEPDPLVRRTPVEEVNSLYPACVAMYTEEIGISPEADGGANLYRARVTQLVNRGWSFSRIEAGKVLFKAEVACVSEHAAQVQGVYVAPDLRNRGLATHGMAAVVSAIRAEIAPTVSLYVNGHNESARAAYQKVGFTQTGTFSTLMF